MAAIGRLTDFADGEALTTLNAAWITELLDSVKLRRASSEDQWGDWPGDGGLRRFGFLVNAKRPASGNTVYVLDDQLDWRDRLLLVTVVSKHWAVPSEQRVPGYPRDKEFRTLLSQVAYTGAGEVANTAASSSTYHLPLKTNLNLYADKDTGKLVIDYRTAAADDAASLGIVIVAAEQTGEKTASPPPDLPALGAVDNNLIHPVSLNVVQDYGMLGQLGGGPSPANLASQLLPLGPRRQGSPPRPFLAPTPDRPTRRQQPVGQIIRYFGVQVATGAGVMLDASIDWRDRMLWGVGRYDAGIIVPGGAQANVHNAATSWSGRAAYTGPGRNETSLASALGDYLLNFNAGNTMGIVASQTDGRLWLRNDSGTTYYFTGMIWATFRTGMR